MMTEILIDQPVDSIIDDWDFFDETILKRFSTFRLVGQNIYGIRARAVGAADVVDPKKGKLEAIVMSPAGIEVVERAPMQMSITAGGVPHRVRHSFGYWHINDMDELAVAIPPLPGEDLGRTLLLMQTPSGNEGESFAWYCNECNTLVHEYYYKTGQMGFEGFWRAETAAVERYNSDERNRLCPDCGYVNPLAYCWNVAKDKPAQNGSSRALVNSEAVKACRLDDIADGSALLVRVKQQKIVLTRIGSEVFALQDACPHKGGALSAGRVNAGRCELICPLHFFRFDLRTGASVTNPELVTPSFDVTVFDGDVYVGSRKGK